MLAPRDVLTLNLDRNFSTLKFLAHIFRLKPPEKPDKIKNQLLIQLYNLSKNVSSHKVGRKQMPQRPKLINEVRKKIRLKHDSIRTEEAYVNWIRRYILFHNKRHPREIGSYEIA